MSDFDLALTPRHNKMHGGRLGHLRTPIIGFKHITAEHAEAFFLGDSIQLATYEYYNKGEGDRVDPLEGQAINGSGEENLYYHARCGNAGAIEFMNRLFGSGWQAQPRTVDMTVSKNVIHYRLSPAYIFCASLEPDVARISAGERCFLIHDMIEFASQLANARSDLLTNWGIGSVVYEKREVNVLQQGIRESDPFRKDERFRPENEVRIAFEPGPIPDDPLRIKMPFAPRLLTEVFGPFTDRGAAAYITSRALL